LASIVALKPKVLPLDWLEVHAVESKESNNSIMMSGRLRFLLRKANWLLLLGQLAMVWEGSVLQLEK